MQTLTESLIAGGLRDRALTERQLERVIGDSPGRRYGLVNRALKAAELIRIRRGLYVLAPKLRAHSLHPFALAQALEPGSYVSFETALSHHGWIPESVRVTASVVPGRKSSQLDHAILGSFTFHPLALHRTHFLELIERQQLDNQTALIASPARALMDLVTLRKVEWTSLAWLTEGLRIEAESLKRITRKQIQTLATVYKQKRSNQFLTELAKELDLD
jgi:predicted transcriptional regulator of viral defense system